MKNKRYIIIAVIVIIVIIAVIMITQPFKWSEKSFEAVVQKTVTQSDGEVRLIVERISEIYGSPMNSLGISEETKLVDANGEVGDWRLPTRRYRKCNSERFFYRRNTILLSSCV